MMDGPFSASTNRKFLLPTLDQSATRRIDRPEPRAAVADGFDRVHDIPGRMILDSTTYPVTLGVQLKTSRWEATVTRTTWERRQDPEDAAIQLLISHTDGRRSSLAVARDPLLVPESWQRENPSMNIAQPGSMERNAIIDLLIERLR